MHAYYPSIQETGVQGPQYEASLDYMLKPYLRNRTKQNKS